jgi:aldose 1-epimerase
MKKKFMKKIILLSFVIFCLACSRTPKVEKEYFGRLSDGSEVTLFRLSNASGAHLEVIDYGCRIVDISVPDRKGVIDDVVPGYEDIESFETGKERFFGSIIGRYANRIDNASFTLDSTIYYLSANEDFEGNPVHCHGGFKGFDRVMWNAESITEEERVGVIFKRLSPDGEEGFPGNLDCTVTYWWSKDNVFRIEYKATTDKSTIVNLSNHTFFNLKGQTGGYVMDHIMQVDADNYLPNTNHFVPKGKSMTVENTPFDMRKPHRVDYAIDTPNEHFRTMFGFSVCWVLNKPSGIFGKAADLYEPRSGRGVETWTTEPGLLTYTGRGFNEDIIGKGGKPIEKFGGMLLETLHFPDSPNRSDFPSTVLKPGEIYTSATEYRFYFK